jgi:hypothetical protein
MREDSVFEVVQRISQLYRGADRRTKGELLDELVLATGYHRKTAIRLLLQLCQKRPDLPRGRPRLYDAEVVRALRLVWESCDCLCSSRLKPFIPELVKSLRRHGDLEIPAVLECRLLSLSRSTIDRLLRPFRLECCRPFSTTRPGTLLGDSVPDQTSRDGGADALGLLTVDAIPHTGGSPDLDYLTTLTAQDLATGWSECSVVWTHRHQLDLAIDEIRNHLPFPINRIETTDGGGLMSESLDSYCRGRDIVFIARSVPVAEAGNFGTQKSWTVVRKLVGFDRYASQEEQRRLRETYGLAKLYMNFFQPHRRLVGREISGTTARKKYSEALTPYQRLLEVGGITTEKERQLKAIYEQLSPLQLRSQIYARLDGLRPLD